MDAEDLGRAKGQDGALDGGYRAMSIPDRRDQLVYLFGEGGDSSATHPSQRRFSGPQVKRPSHALGVVEH